MSASRKHSAQNERVNEAHERKELKEEQQRLERIGKQKVRKGSVNMVDMFWYNGKLPFNMAV